MGNATMGNAQHGASRLKQRYQTWSRRSPAFKAATVAGAALVVIGFGSITGFALGALHTRPDGYLYKGPITVEFVQFNEDSGGHLAGTLYAVAESGQTTSNTSASFAGVQSGSDITLTFSQFGASNNMTGTLDNNTLTLHSPDANGYVETLVLQGASTRDYNSAAAHLQKQVLDAANAQRAAQATAAAQQAAAQATAQAQQAKAQAAAAAQAQLDQTVAQANATLEGDLNTLNSDTTSLTHVTDFSNDLTAYGQAWQQMQSDYAQEQHEASNGCGPSGGNASVVAGDASVVDGDLSVVHGDDSVLSSDLGTAGDAIGAVQQDIRNVQSDWQALQTATANDPNGTGAQYTQQQVKGFIDAGQKAIDTENGNISSAKTASAKYDNEASQLDTSAHNVSTSMTC